MSVRVGFIGTGGIAQSHLRTLVELPDVELVALCDVSTERVEAAKARLLGALARQAQSAGTGGGQAEAKVRSAKAYDDYRRMLAAERLDAVFICLPPYVHGDPELAVIEAGAAMLVEKPVALDLEVAGRILEGIRAKGLIAASGYQLRYAPDVIAAKEILKGRTIGMATAMRYGGTPATPWYHRQEKSGGQLIEMATHEMDLLRNLVGDVDVVYAQGDTRINHRNNPEYNIFDVNCATLRFKNGAVGSFSNNFICGYGAPEHAQGVHIMADELTVSFRLGRGITVRTPSGVEQLPGGENPMAIEDKTFIAAVKEGRPELILSTYENGVRTLATTLAADRSARTGEPVRVDDLLKEVPGL